MANLERRIETQNALATELILTNPDPDSLADLAGLTTKEGERLWRLLDCESLEEIAKSEGLKRPRDVAKSVRNGLFKIWKCSETR